MAAVSRILPHLAGLGFHRLTPTVVKAIRRPFFPWRSGSDRGHGLKVKGEDGGHVLQERSFRIPHGDGHL